MSALPDAMKGLAEARAGLMGLTAVENPMVSGLPAHLSRIERRDDRIDRAHEALVGEYMAAAVTNPLLKIGTPGWGDEIGGRREAQMIDVLSDQLGGKSSDALWAELVGILSKSVLGMRFLKARAEEHATFHEIEAAEA